MPEKEWSEKECIIRVHAKMIAEALGYRFVTMEDTEDWVEAYGPEPTVNDFSTKCIGPECAQWSRLMEGCGLRSNK